MRWILAVIILSLLVSSVTADDWKFQIIDSSTPVFTLVKDTAEVVNQPKLPQQNEHLVMFTSKTCGPCQAWKNGNNRKQIEAKYKVVIVDIDDFPVYKTAQGNLPAVDRYPKFWLIKTSDLYAKPIKVWTGGISLQDIETTLKAPAAPQSGYKRKSKLRWSLNGSFSPNRKTLVEHIKEEHGIEINETMFSYEELLAIHDDLHNNVYVSS